MGGGDARKMQGNFWFLHARVRERVRGAFHSSSGFSAKYIRTLSNKHRQNWKSESEPEMGSARSADSPAFPPKKSESERIFHAPRGSSFANAI